MRRLAEQVAADVSLKDKQPYRAAASGDLSWFGDAVTKHYDGDDAQVKILAEAILSAFQGLTVEEHAQRVKAFFADALHPTLNRPYTSCGYTPMVELLRYLEANGFAYIASGGGRDFMRPVTAQMYGLPPEQISLPGAWFIAARSTMVSYRDRLPLFRRGAATCIRRTAPQERIRLSPDRGTTEA